ncbi:MAG: hypothetical protein RIQ41_119 [Candidatus Parcubacteria bacterium]|jgi:hypothetical protein
MLKRLLMALVAIFLFLGAASAQDNSVYQVEMRKAASEALMRQQVIVLTGKGYLDSWFEIWLYPQRGVFHLQGKNLCYSGEESATFVVNDFGYLSVYVPGKFGIIQGCTGGRINIDPVNNLAGWFDYNPVTREQSSGAGRLYLRR